MRAAGRRRISRITLADRARDAQQWEIAIEHYRAALARNPFNAPIWVQFGNVLKEAGHHARAEGAYRAALEDDPGVADTHLQLGHLLKLQGRREEADESYRRALALDPAAEAARRELAGAEIPEDELARLRGELARAAQNTDRRRRRRSRITRADRAQLAGQWEHAAALYRAALLRNPANAPIWVQYGHALKEFGDLQGAEAAYRRALAHNPANADPYLHLGYAARLQGRKEDAEAAYLRAFALAPDISYPLDELARMGWSGPQLRQLSALETYSIASDPEESQPHARVGSLDGMHGATAAGWAWDPRSPGTPATVEFLVDGTVVHQVRADIYRDDIKRAGYGSGYAGFETALPLAISDAATDVSARLAGTSWELDNSPASAQQRADITRWLRRSEKITPMLRLRLKERLNRETKGILISVVMPIYNTKDVWLKEALDSLLAQWCDHWELVCVNNGSTEPHVETILQDYSIKDSRIKIVTLASNSEIAGGTNAGLNVAIGQIIALMDSDDYLEPDAIYKYLRAFIKTGADLIYCDELITGVDLNVVHFAANRPAYSWDYYIAHPYFVHMICISRQLLEMVKGWNELMKVSGDVDFVLRCQEHAKRVAHIPSVLYRWRTHPSSSGHQMKNHVTAATVAALNRHLARCAPGAVAEAGLAFNYYKIDFPDDRQKTLIIIPTKNAVHLLRPCIISLLETTKPEEIEICIIDHQSDDDESVEYINSLRATIAVIPYHGAFNYAAMNNKAVQYFRNERKLSCKYLLFMNNDVKAIEPGWLEHMRGLAGRPDVGVVGATLLYPDDRVQHAGVIVGLNGPGDHAHKFLPFRTGPDRTQGHLGSLICTREYSAVTAACMITRADVFAEMGGFDENLVVGFNDTDYCLRVRESGYKILNDAHSVLYHYESATRSGTGELRHPNDDMVFLKRWGGFIRGGDPYYSPLLSLRGPGYHAERYSSVLGRVRTRPSLMRMVQE